MSVRVMAWVWAESQAAGVDRLVLLAIADCANDAGEEAYPSMATLRKKTLLSERTIQRALKSLVEIGELTVAVNGGPRGCNRYRIKLTPVNVTPPSDCHPPRQPDPRQDDATPVNVTPHPRQADTPTPVTVTPEPSFNRKRTKEPKTSSVTLTRPDVDQICDYLADKIESNGSKRPTITARWRTAGRLLLDADGKTVEQVIKAIDWCQADAFWRSNVLSMPKLRDKYDQLRLAAQRPNGRASPLVEVNGMRLRPDTAANLSNRAKWEAQDQIAIEGPK